MANSAALQERPRRFTCKDCAFFGILDHVTPICRFDPPKILPVMPRPAGDGWLSTVAWPDVSPDTDWCGRFIHHQRAASCLDEGPVQAPPQKPGELLHHQV